MRASLSAYVPGFDTLKTFYKQHLNDVVASEYSGAGHLFCGNVDSSCFGWCWVSDRLGV